MTSSCCHGIEASEVDFDSACSRMFFPMWLLSVPLFLEMRGPPADHGSLKEDNKLTQRFRGAFAIFVSHQWVGGDVPDPNGEQLEYLRGAIRNIICGCVSLEYSLEGLLLERQRCTMSQQDVFRLEHGYIWMDWFSVPQIGHRSFDAATSAATKLAVDSIPAYVDASDMMLVLAPAMRNVDDKLLGLASWCARGWCRVEFIAACMAKHKRENFHVLIIRSVVDVSMLPLRESCFMPPGKGLFTVEEDRVLVFSVMEEIIDYCTRSLAARQDQLAVCTSRLLIALRSTFLVGLGTQEQKMASLLPSSEVQHRFLSRFRFGSLLDAGTCGVGPLVCAAICNNLGVVTSAIEAEVDVNSRITLTIKNLFIQEGTTPLHLAVLYGENSMITRALIEAGANISATTVKGALPINFGCFVGNAHAVELLIMYNADSNGRGWNGMTPIQSAVFGGHDGVVRQLLHCKASHDVLGLLGNSLLHICCAPTLSLNRLACATALLEALVDVNDQREPAGLLRAGWSVVRFASKFTQFSRAQSFNHFVNVIGCTCVGMASMTGDACLVKLLMTARANPYIKNSAGYDALDLARARGHTLVEEILLDALDLDAV